ncbi:hypothetical protein J6590_042179 [Homalodisca vitripennis]|nr:hypothetical protein J6590_042179 [Homalodisca vitripennis]
MSLPRAEPGRPWLTPLSLSTALSCSASLPKQRSLVKIPVDVEAKVTPGGMSITCRTAERSQRLSVTETADCRQAQCSSAHRRQAADPSPLVPVSNLHSHHLHLRRDLVLFPESFSKTGTGCDTCDKTVSMGVVQIWNRSIGRIKEISIALIK